MSIFRIFLLHPVRFFQDLLSVDVVILSFILLQLIDPLLQVHNATGEGAEIVLLSEWLPHEVVTLQWVQLVQLVLNVATSSSSGGCILARSILALPPILTVVAGAAAGHIGTSI